MHVEPSHPSDEHLLLALARELPADIRNHVNAHIRACGTCQERLHGLRRAESEIRRVLAGASASADDTAGLRQRVARALANPAAPEATIHRLVRRYRPGRVAAAVAATLILTAAAVAWVGRQHPVGSGDPSASPSLPIPVLTPGATTNVSMDLVCAATEPPPPPVPADMRDRVLRSYAMHDVPHEEFELDYLITPQLGGATHPANLWPERYDSPVWNAKVKDQLETLLPALVCSGAVELTEAQQEIARDWIAAYKKYFKTDMPLRPGAGTAGETEELTAAPASRAPVMIMSMARMLR